MAVTASEEGMVDHRRVARRTAAAVCKKVLNTLIWRWSCVGNRCMKNYHNTKICAPSRQTSTHIVQHSLYDNGRCFKLPQCRKWLQTYKTLLHQNPKNRKEQLCILYRCYCCCCSCYRSCVIACSNLQL